MRAEHHDPHLGVLAPHAASDLEALVGEAGGMRMSVTTTSGECRSMAREELVAVPAGGEQLHLVARLEDAEDALAHEEVVLRDDHADPHGRDDTR